MSEVRSEMRVLQIFELFAKERKPLRLSEISAGLQIPVSSCFALIKNLITSGYLYEIKSREGYYPTGRILRSVNIIANHDPITSHIQGRLIELRDRTGETVTFGKQVRDQTIYLAAVESQQSIHLVGRPGLMRPLHVNAMGKALLSTLDAAEMNRLLRNRKLVALTPNTITSPAALEKEISEGRRNGWFRSVEESTDDAMALAMIVRIDSQSYGVQVAGPVHRMTRSAEKFIMVLRDVVLAIESDMETVE